MFHSPTGCGTSRLSGSQPNLENVDLDAEFETSSHITTRGNKRKNPHGDDIFLLRREISEMRKEMSEMMAVLTASSKDQNEKINTLCQTVTSIKEDVKSFGNTIKAITSEQVNINNKLEHLKTEANGTGKKIEVLESDIASLRNTISSHSDSERNLNVEDFITEMQERTIRAKNIIIVGIAESGLKGPAERRESDKQEVLKTTRSILVDCPEPDKVIRLGKFNSNKNRPIRVCYKSDETPKTLLRNKRNKDDPIKFFSDQTVNQQKNLRKLKKELETRVQKGETNLQIKYVKGTPKIVKSFEQQTMPNASQMNIQHIASTQSSTQSNFL